MKDSLAQIIADGIVGCRRHATVSHVLGGVSKGFESTSQRRRQLRVDDEAHLRAPQDGVVVLARGECQYRSDVVRLQISVVGEDLLVGRTRRQEVEDVLHTNAEATDARASSAHRGIDGNSIEFAHLSASC